MGHNTDDAEIVAPCRMSPQITPLGHEINQAENSAAIKRPLKRRHIGKKVVAGLNEKCERERVRAVILRGFLRARERELRDRIKVSGQHNQEHLMDTNTAATGIKHLFPGSSLLT